MKLFIRLAKKKRAISPVIAIVLLIGLAVAATAAIFLVVLPLMQPTQKLDMTDAYILYDDDYTTAADEGEGYGKGIVVLANGGTGKIEITNISITYSIVVTGPWNPVPGAISLQSITPDNPYEIEPIDLNEELTVRFPLPDENDDQTVFYRMVVKTKEGAEKDTTEETETVSEEDMQLSKDRPDISFTGTLDYVRRTQTISPTSVSDNSEIKKVAYQVYNSTWSMTKNITSPLWRWNWATYESISNGTYNMNMTVYDYAGLSKIAKVGSFTIDNDYIPPNVGSLWITSPYPVTQSAEVGEFVATTVEITDGGTEEAGASQVDRAYLYYRLNGTSNVFSSISMGRDGTTNNYTANIASSFLDSNALDSGVECYVYALDLDDNSADTSSNPKKFAVEDNYVPNIVHSAVDTGTAGNVITIAAQITDKDQVNQSNVKLYWRQTDDHGGTNTTWNIEEPYISNDDYTWTIWGSDVTIFGLDYFFNATDRNSGHVAYEGSQTSPNHISIPDQVKPIISHSPTAKASHNVDLTITCVIWDNDPTFGSGSPSGDVWIHACNYNGGTPSFSPIPMSKISGDSSISNNYENPSSTIWSGIIDASLIVETDGTPYLYYYIEAEDEDGNTIQDGEPWPGDPWHEVLVIPQGEPSLVYISDSVKTSGVSNNTVEFTIKNEAAPGSTARANIARLKFTIYSDVHDFSTYFPLLNTTTFNGTQVWTDANGVENNSWIQFNPNSTLPERNVSIVKLTFENTTGDVFEMFDLDFVVTLEAYNTADVGKNHTIIFSTPPATISQKRYMRSDYTLLTTQTTSYLERDSGAWVWGGSSVTWGIRVFVGTTPITTGLVAAVDSSGMEDEEWTFKDGFWNCPKTTLQPTDSITISVRAILGTTERTLADFTTGQLGATQLSAASWTVHYHIRWNQLGGQNRYRAYLRFGDTTYDSSIDNFTIRPSN